MPNKTWVKPTVKNLSYQEGYLKAIADSSIIIADRWINKKSNFTTYTVKVENIEELQFWEKGKVGKGILTGALAGFAFGGILSRNTQYTRGTQKKLQVGGVGI